MQLEATCAVHRRPWGAGGKGHGVDQAAYGASPHQAWPQSGALRGT